MATPMPAITPMARIDRVIGWLLASAKNMGPDGVLIGQPGDFLTVAADLIAAKNDLLRMASKGGETSSLESIMQQNVEALKTAMATNAAAAIKQPPPAPAPAPAAAPPPPAPPPT